MLAFLFITLIIVALSLFFVRWIYSQTEYGQPKVSNVSSKCCSKTEVNKKTTFESTTPSTSCCKKVEKEYNTFKNKKTKPYKKKSKDLRAQSNEILLDSPMDDVNYLIQYGTSQAMLNELDSYIADDPDYNQGDEYFNVPVTENYTPPEEVKSYNHYQEAYSRSAEAAEAATQSYEAPSHSYGGSGYGGGGGSSSDWGSSDSGSSSSDSGGSSDY